MQNSRTWLAIGIPTFPRHNDTDYLTSTLQHLLAELTLDPTDPLFDKVKVLVMNNKPGQHSIYTKVQKHILHGAHEQDDLFARKAMQYVEFTENPGMVEDPTPPDKPEPDDFDNPNNIPGRFALCICCRVAQRCCKAGQIQQTFCYLNTDHTCMSKNTCQRCRSSGS